jgi:hypothetical protein
MCWIKFYKNHRFADDEKKSKFDASSITWKARRFEMKNCIAAKNSVIYFMRDQCELESVMTNKARIVKEKCEACS